MRIYNKTLILTTILSVLITAAVNLHPAEIDGVYFKDEYQAGKRMLELRGYAVLNYMLVIKAYAGALYIEKNTASDTALNDVHRILELYYFHKISAEDFRESTSEMIKRNTTENEFMQLSEKLVTFNNLYKDVKPGDRYRAEYIPGRGTTLYLNGQPLGTVTGAGFSKAIFSIWLGRDPIDKKFRDELLGRKR